MLREQHGRRLTQTLNDSLSDVVARIIDVRRARDLVAEFIRDRREVSGNRTAERGKACGVIRMGVDDAADRGPALVNVEVVRQVDGGLPSPLHPPAFEVGHREVRRAQLLIIHAARLDDHQPPAPVDAAGISAVHGHQTGPEDSQICLPDLTSQLLKRRHL